MGIVGARSAAPFGGRVGVAGGLGIGEHGVDLPTVAVGAVHPAFVLVGAAAVTLALTVHDQSSGSDSIELGVDVVGGLMLDTQVVDGAVFAPTFGQHELQRRVGDGEVRIATLELGRRRGEQFGLVLDGRLEVVDIHGELESGHGLSLYSKVD